MDRQADLAARLRARGIHRRFPDGALRLAACIIERDGREPTNEELDALFASARESGARNPPAVVALDLERGRWLDVLRTFDRRDLTPRRAPASTTKVEAPSDVQWDYVREQIIDLLRRNYEPYEIGRRLCWSEEHVWIVVEKIATEQGCKNAKDLIRKVRAEAKRERQERRQAARRHVP